MLKAYETQKVGNALIQAVVAEEIKRQKTAREAELEAQVKQLSMELELRKQRDRKTFTRFIDEANRYYRANERHNAITDILWTLYAWTILAFGALFDALGL